MVYKGKSPWVRAGWLSVLCLAASAVYADQPADSATTTPEFFGVKPPVDFSWAGPYVGGYVGGAWADANMKTTVGPLTGASYFTSSSDAAAVSQSGTNVFHPSTPIVGVEFGDNFVISPLVTVGWVMDYSSFDLSETHSATNIPYPSGAGDYSLQTSVSTSWLSTVRGRLGVTPHTAWPMMAYATGGLAVANVKVSNSFSDTSSLAGISDSSSSNNQIGWTLGAGLDVPLTQHLTINAEYLYIDLGSVDTTSSIQNTAGGFGVPANSLASPLDTSVDLHTSLFKLGLSYKF